MRRNNKGFSLVELIVALAIFTIAGVAVFGFMANSSRLYQRTNVEVKLQYEQQLAVNQIRDMVVESDKGIYFDEDATEKTLALYGAAKQEGVATVYPVTVVRYVQSEQRIYYGIKNFAALADVSFDSVESKKLLAENVKEFKVDLKNVKNDKVYFEVTFIVSDKEQTAKETVALRNRLVVSNEVDTIWGDVPVVVDSFIRKIAICRDGKEFANGDQDTIGKADSDVVVVYTAKVIASEDSDRDYKVSWSLSPKVEGVGVSDDGEVTVAAKAKVSDPIHLRAISVDDPSKYAEITIIITNNGVYPQSMSLVIGDITEGNGFRTYKLVPTVTYTDGRSASDYDLFTWEMPKNIPEGCTFNKDTGVLTLGPGANGRILTVTANTKERNMVGDVLSASCVIDVSGITEYVPGPSVKIVCAKNLSRGGCVFPTMVFENATHSSYTYDWKIEPYADGESDVFTNSNDWNDTSRFNLVSMTVSGYYSDGNVQHTMHTNANRRSVTVNCASHLDWNKTFKIKISGTATDNEGNVLVATPVVVAVEPVELIIKGHSGPVNGEDNDATSITDSVLMYEDYCLGPTSDSNITTRRWFDIYAENLYINGNFRYQLQPTHHIVVEDAAHVLLDVSNNGINPNLFMDRLVCGFKLNLTTWSGFKTLPSYVTYSITLEDSYKNLARSNSVDFSVVYEKYTKP